ncbi:hypothetical protein [uncultured Roseovarius sp.]|uniref:hypothetical protein n=1 Tax=uncultured Roseovarius sp. TaxID=293344 RepID=UPI002626F0E4|nr:hypothetical protein [uncultured Roseovarius sp.]
MSRQIRHILSLTEAFTAHEAISHWALSKRLMGKGDFIDRLLKGGDVRTQTAEAFIRKLSRAWPTDLEWPRDIPRPSSKQEDAA